MSKSLINEQESIYRKNFLEHGDTPKGLFWNNIDTQYLRFERLLKNIDTSKSFSIHDVGCGTCALHQYMSGRKIKHTYHGSEIVDEMIAAAKKKYKKVAIHKRTILDTPIETCDWVVASGTFNMKQDIKLNDWKKYTFNSIKKMYSCSAKGIAFNLLTSYNTFSSPGLAYFDPKEVLDYCLSNLSRFVIVDEAYPLYEFTVTVFRDAYMKGQFNAPTYEKYFAGK